MPTNPPRLLPWLLLGLTALGAGLLNGLLGAAGGVLLLTVLPRLTPPPLLDPSSPPPSHPLPPLGHSLLRRDLMAVALAVMLPVSGVSALLYRINGISPPPGLSCLLLLPAASGGLLGAVLLGRLPDHILRRVFAALVVVAGIRMLF